MSVIILMMLYELVMSLIQQGVPELPLKQKNFVRKGITAQQRNSVSANRAASAVEAVMFQC